MRRLILIVSSYLLSTDLSSADCSQQNKPGELHFTSDVNEIDYAYLGHHKVLDCCATGYDRLLWFHKRKGDIFWEPFPFSLNEDERNNVDEKHKNQTLVIYSMEFNLTGIFKCVATNFTLRSNKNISLEIELEIDDSYGPDKVIPAPPSRYVCIENTTVTVSCSADYGRPGSIGRDVGWEAIGDNKIHPERINKSKWSSFKDTVAGSTITIVNVTDIDVGSTFQCYILAVQDGGKNYYYNTTFVRNGKCESTLIPFNNKKVIVAVLSFLACAIFIILTSLAVRRQYRYSILIHIRSHFPCWYYSVFGGTDPMLGKKTYHALLHCSDDNTQMAKDLCKEITAISDSYKLCVPSDACSGLHMQSIGELAKEAATLVIVYPNHTSPNVSRFNCEVSSMLKDYFKDQENTVTVVYTGSSRMYTVPNEIKGLCHVTVCKSQNRWWKPNGLQKLQLRMPLPGVHVNHNLCNKSTLRKENKSRKDYIEINTK